VRGRIWQLHGDYDPATIVIYDRALRRAAECTIRGGDVRRANTLAICLNQSAHSAT
jgi:hypothetical protein